MFEQDIELACLLVGKLAELDQRSEDALEKLRAAKEELAEAQTVRDERASYVDILSRAAKVLERADLETESPGTSELETQINNLDNELQAIAQEAGTYRELVAELREKAPQLIAAAEGQALPSEENTAEENPGPEQAVSEEKPAELAVEDEAPDNDVPEAVTVEEEAPGDAAEDATAPAQDVTVKADLDSEQILARFNLGNMKTREAITLGRGAAYVIDGSSAVERVPNYDHYIRQIEESQARDELIRDIDCLSRELTGAFNIVFNSWYQPSVSFANNISVIYATGEGEGTSEAGERHLRELVGELAAKHRIVCVVTGNTTLADSVRGQGIHIIPLGEFYST